MRQTRSIVSISARRSWSRRRASRPKGRLQRLTRKPGPSAARMTVLPIARPVASAISRGCSPERSPATTSSSRITGAGLKKCIPTTRSGTLAARAISVTSIEEVLVASTQSSATIELSLSSSSCLSSRRSGTASITSPQSRSCSSSPTACRRSEAAAASSALEAPAGRFLAVTVTGLAQTRLQGRRRSGRTAASPRPPWQPAGRSRRPSCRRRGRRSRRGRGSPPPESPARHAALRPGRARRCRSSRAR